MSGVLAGKVVVVTGSTRGIGLAIVRGCAQAGADVVTSSRSEDAVAASVHALAAQGVSRVAGLAADVRSSDDLEHLWDFAEAAFGRVDVWVNNAGVSAGYRPVDEMTPDEIREVVDINLTGTLIACRLVVPRMMESGGVLVNMAGRGFRGEATPYTAVYAATKSAVVSATRSIARENRSSRVSVHALVPGMVATDFYRDTVVSPRLEGSRGNIALALDAFGVPLATISAEVPRILAQKPGEVTGRVYSLLTPARTARGIGKMMWWRATGRMKDEP